MSNLHQVGDIQVHEDLPFLKQEWRVQRIGWVAISIILVLAMLGVFGRGPMAKDSAGDVQTFGVEFDRVVRHGADTDLVVRVGAGLQPEPTLRIFLPRAYLNAFHISDVVPKPVSSGVKGDLAYYDFVRDDVRTHARISFQLHATGYWHHSARVSLGGATAVTFSQLILP